MTNSVVVTIPSLTSSGVNESTYVFFFFSSRRRHTRSDRDWSSDVCSSDLVAIHDPYAPELSASSGPAADPTRWGFINHQGELVTSPHFLLAEDFHGGVA